MRNYFVGQEDEDHNKIGGKEIIKPKVLERTKSEKPQTRGIQENLKEGCKEAITRHCLHLKINQVLMPRVDAEGFILKKMKPLAPSNNWLSFKIELGVTLRPLLKE